MQATQRGQPDHQYSHSSLWPWCHDTLQLDKIARKTLRPVLPRRRHWNLEGTSPLLWEPWLSGLGTDPTYSGRCGRCAEFVFSGIDRGKCENGSSYRLCTTSHTCPGSKSPFQTAFEQPWQRTSSLLSIVLLPSRFYTHHDASCIYPRWQSSLMAFWVDTCFRHWSAVQIESVCTFLLHPLGWI